MSVDAEITVFVAGLLAQMLRDHEAEQLFLFGPDAEPFWVARRPIWVREYNLLGEAIDLLNELESKREKPFVALGRDREYVVAALAGDSDLFLVLVGAQPSRVAAEARIALIRDQLAPKLEHLRTAELRIAVGLSA